MTSQHRILLNDLNRKHLVERHPSVPKMAIPGRAYSDKTANGLTRCIMDYIRFTGGHAERIANMGRVIKRKGRSFYIPGAGRNGSADIHAIIDGKPWMIEVKMGRDRQSVAQVHYMADIIRSGGRYIVVKSFEEFINQLNHVTDHQT